MPKVIFRSLVNFLSDALGRSFCPNHEGVDPRVYKEDFKTPLTANVAESYKLVIDDMNAGIEGLPEESASGRVNKYVAYAFRCRAAPKLMLIRKMRLIWICALNQRMLLLILVNIH